MKPLDLKSKLKAINKSLKSKYKKTKITQSKPFKAEKYFGPNPIILQASDPDFLSKLGMEIEDTFNKKE